MKRATAAVARLGALYVGFHSPANAASVVIKNVPLMQVATNIALLHHRNARQPLVSYTPTLQVYGDNNYAKYGMCANAPVDASLKARGVGRDAYSIEAVGNDVKVTASSYCFAMPSGPAFEMGAADAAKIDKMLQEVLDLDASVIAYFNRPQEGYKEPK